MFPFHSNDIWVFTSTLPDLSVASPKHSDEGLSVMRSGPDVAILSEQDVVTVLHTAETANRHTRITGKSTNKKQQVADRRKHTIQRSSGSRRTECTPPYVPAAGSLRHSGKTTRCCPLEAT